MELDEVHQIFVALLAVQGRQKLLQCDCVQRLLDALVKYIKDFMGKNMIELIHLFRCWSGLFDQGDLNGSENIIGTDRARMTRELIAAL